MIRGRPIATEVRVLAICVFIIEPVLFCTLIAFVGVWNVLCAHRVARIIVGSLPVVISSLVGWKLHLRGENFARVPST